MNFWIKIQNLLNNFIGLIIKLIAKFYDLVVPEYIKKKIDIQKDRIIKKNKILQNICLKLFKGLREKFTNGVERLKHPSQNFNKALGHSLSFFSNFNIKKFSLKTFTTKTTSIIGKKTGPSSEKFKTWFNNLEPKTMLVVIITFTSIILIMLGIFGYVRKIYYGAAIEGKGRMEFEQKIKTPRTRPSYFKRILPEKHIDIYEITLPIYIESINSVRTLMIDVTLETSNRYLKQFLYEKSYLIKDRLNNTIHPIIPDFPLTLEGKLIIKKQIIDEINILIKELKIEGEIKKVHFQTVIAA